MHCPKGIRIGIDPTWYALGLDEQTANVNGFVAEILLDLSEKLGREFEAIPANSDSLYDGMRQGIYDVVFSTLSPEVFCAQQYDFSQNFLATGPVLVTRSDVTIEQLQHAVDKHIGFVRGSSYHALLRKYPNLLIRDTYASIPSLLSAVAVGEIEGALLPSVVAIAYVADLFASTLHIATSPLNAEGLRIIALKGKQHFLLEQIDRRLQALKEERKWDAVCKKWRI